MSVPIVMQAGPSDCGAACAAMVIGARRGEHVAVTELDELRALADRDGMSVATVRKALSGKDVTTKGVRLKEPRQLAALPAPSIALYDKHHFVVVEATARRWVQVCDPAIGRKRLSWDEFGERFTGVLILVDEPANHSRGDLAATLSRTVRNSVLHRFAKAWPAQLRRPLLTICMLTVLVELVGAGIILLVRHVLNGGDTGLVGALLMALLLVAFVELAGRVVRNLLAARLTNHGEFTMRESVFKKILGLDFSHFQYRSPGYLGDILNNTRQLNDAFLTTVVTSTLNVVAGTLALGLLLATNLTAGLVVATLVVVVYASALLARRRISSVSKVEFEQRAQIAGLTDEILRAIEGLRGIGAHPQVTAAWLGRLGALRRSSLASRLWNQGASAFALGAARILQIGVITVVVIKSHGQIAAGDLVAVVSFSAAAFTPLLEAAQRTLRWGEIDVLLAQLSDIWDRPVASSMAHLPRGTRESDQAGYAAMALAGIRIAFGAGEPVVQDASFTVRRGERIGISAPSGAGKSTLLRAIAGMISPRAGKITVDGEPLAAAAEGGFRIGYVPQDVHLLTGTIAENLRAGAPDASDEQLWSACRRAQVADDIARFPHQLDTRLGGGGAGLSGGQRQRLAIARALLTCPWLLMLDEATSALDHPTEGRLLRALPGMALLVVSHRPEVMAAMDRVLMLEDGCLRELPPGRVNDRSVTEREEVTMNENLQIEELSPAEEAELLGGAAIGSTPGGAHVMIGDE